jgi:teichuronic acid biosynthesis glycosyltransferase TuaC
MKQRLRVLALSYLYPNSLNMNHGIFVHNRLMALSRYVDVKVINPIPWFPVNRFIGARKSNSQIPAEEILDGLDVFHPRFLSIPKYFKSLECSAYLRSICPVIEKIRHDFDFDIIDMHWTFPDLPAGLEIARRYNCKSMVTLRGMEAFHRQDKDQRQNIVEQGLNKVDGIVSLSLQMKQLADGVTNESDKSSVIRNGVDVDTFYYQPQKVCRELLSLEEDQPFVLSVGSLIYRKGFDVILKSMRKIGDVSNFFQNYKLYIIGSEGAEGDYRTELKRLISELGIESRVVFVGKVDNQKLRNWYNACDAFCLASRGEGSPNVLSEALACGCPSITTDVGSASEIIESNDAFGACIKPGSEAELTKAFLQVLKTKYERKAIADNFAQFDWDWCAKKVVVEYNRILNKIEN